MKTKNNQKKVIIYSDSNWSKFWDKDLINFYSSKNFCVEYKNVEEFYSTFEKKLSVRRIFENSIIIKKEYSKKYIIIVYDDRWSKGKLILKNLPKIKIEKIFMSQFREKEFSFFEKRLISPFTYRVANPDEFDKFFECKNENKTENAEQKIFFAGNTVGTGIINKRNEVITKLPDILAKNEKEKFSYSEYLEKLSSSFMALSLPGYGDFCFREIECFGAKVPCIMPKKINNYKNPLIPDFHYISIDVDWEKDSSELIAQKINEKFLQVKDNSLLLNEIKNNAYEWYLNNIDRKNNLTPFSKILTI